MVDDEKQIFQGKIVITSLDEVFRSNLYIKNQNELNIIQLYKPIIGVIMEFSVDGNNSIKILRSNDAYLDNQALINSSLNDEMIRFISLLKACVLQKKVIKEHGFTCNLNKEVNELVYIKDNHEFKVTLKRI